MLIRTGQLDLGLPKLRRAQDLQEGIVRDHPKVVFYQFNLAFVCRALGRAAEKAGRGAEAYAAFDRARQLDEGQAASIFIARYNQACDLALMARVAPPGGRSESLVEQALTNLHKAIVQGYRSYVEFANDDDLSAIRPRQEYQSLKLDLAFPQEKPFAPGQ
jgi:hypothetical protein